MEGLLSGRHKAPSDVEEKMFLTLLFMASWCTKLFGLLSLSLIMWQLTPNTLHQNY